MTLELAVFIGLASYRMARFITVEGGPWSFMSKLRGKLNIDFLRCLHCTGVFTSLLLVALYLFVPSAYGVVLFLAVSGLVSFMQDYLLKN